MSDVHKMAATKVQHAGLTQGTQHETKTFWPAGWFGCVPGRLVRWLVAWLAVLAGCILAGWLSGGLAACLPGWCVGWLVGRLAGWLALRLLG